MMSSSSIVVLSEFPSDVLLPSDLFLDVLIRLPFKDLMTDKEKLKYVMRLRCVSRFFLYLINNPTFISYYRTLLFHDKDDKFNFMDTTSTNHLYSLVPSPLRLQWRCLISFKGSNFIYLQKQKQKHHELIPFHCPSHKRLIGSVNGLICFGGNFSLEIYNIFAGTNFYLIPPTTKLSPPNPIFAIGYDPISNDYKIVRFRNQAIYSFKNNSWKLQDGLLSFNTDHSYGKNYDNSLEGCSVCINGVIYWPPGKGYFPTSPWTGIVSLDLHTEKFLKEIQLPHEDLLLPSRYADIQLLSFKGCLAFALMGTKSTKNSRKRKGKGEIWVELFKLKNCKGEEEEEEEDCLWIKESFVVPILSAPQKEAAIVLCCDEIFLGWFEFKQLRLYNLHTKNFFNLPQSSPSHYYPKVSVGNKTKDPTYVDNLRFRFGFSLV